MTAEVGEWRKRALAAEKALKRLEAEHKGYLLAWGTMNETKIQVVKKAEKGVDELFHALVAETEVGKLREKVSALRSVIRVIAEDPGRMPSIQALLRVLKDTE